MLNENIKHLRIVNKLSQVQLADKLGVTKQCVSNWENNNIQPSVDMLVKIASFFGVTTDYLLDLDTKKYLDVSELSEVQFAHIKNIIDDLIQANNDR